MGSIRFDKAIPEEMSAKIDALKSDLSVVFQNMIAFREELERHKGKAASALRKKMDEQIDFFSQASSHLLYFAETIRLFTSAVTSEDNGDSQFQTSAVDRAAFNYSFSSERVGDEIRLDPEALEDASNAFENHIAALNDALSDFDVMLNHMVFDTEFPWQDVDEIWPDGKKKVQAIVTGAKDRLNVLAKEAKALTEEVKRVDHLISYRMMRQS